MTQRIAVFFTAALSLGCGGKPTGTGQSPQLRAELTPEQREDQKRVREETPINANAVGLTREYQKQETADKKYKGKVVQLSGVIDRINGATVDLKGSAGMFRGTSYIWTADCVFLEGTVGSLAVGSKVTIKGICKGRCESSPCLKITNCELVRDGDEPPLVISAADLRAEYLADRTAALAKFTGRTVEISGVIDKFNLVLDRPVIALSPREDGEGKCTVYAGFRTQPHGPARRLTKGQTVRVRGTWYDSGSEIGATDCEVIEVGPMTATASTVDELVRTYVSDRAKAETQYKDKTLFLKGVVVDTDPRTNEQTMLLQSPAKDTACMVRFHPGEVALRDLKKGQTVELRGEFKGMEDGKQTVGDTTVQHYLLLNDAILLNR